MPRPRRRPAFFLLEVIIALVVLALSAAVVAGGAVDSSRRSLRLEAGLHAEQLARSWLEVLRGLSPEVARHLAAASDPGIALGVLVPSLAPHPPGNGAEYRVDLTHEELEPGLTLLEVQVLWERGECLGQARAATLVRGSW